ncbi:hypothetical protein [Deinococcus altitudinis]|uniref:hypothetical protein n=1 Tax=Deinococcus altitudinis TaxID=468914 RepID=UPI003892C500
MTIDHGVGCGWWLAWLLSVFVAGGWRGCCRSSWLVAGVAAIGLRGWWLAWLLSVIVAGGWRGCCRPSWLVWLFLLQSRNGKLWPLRLWILRRWLLWSLLQALDDLVVLELHH